MIYILIATRNRREITQKFLASAFKQTYKDFVVVNVDDGSTDGTREMIKEKFPQTKLLEGDGNLWWTGAMRMGVKYILSVSQPGDYILLQNDDTYIDEDFLKKILTLSEKYGRMILGTTVKDSLTDKTIYNSHRFTRGFFRSTVVEGGEEIIDTDTISGRGTLVPIEVFKKIGNFSKLLPHYGADYDFLCRASRSGFRLGIARYVNTYSTNPTPNLSARIKNLKEWTFSDFFDLYFSRRSSNNLQTATVLIFRNVKFPTNIISIMRTILVALKFLLINVFFNNLRKVFNEK